MSESPRGGALLRTDDGADLFYRCVGSGGEAVVVLGGSLLDQELLPLVAGRELIFYDTRGRGRSDPIRDPSRLGIERELEDLEQLRAHLRLERFSLVGWSVLGAVVALYALRHPERVARILQICPIPPRARPHMAADAAARARRRDPDAERHLDALREAGLPGRDPAAFCRAWYAAFLPTIVGEPARWTCVRVPCELPNEHPDPLAQVGGALFASLGDWDWREDLARLPVPVLTMAGERDTFPLAGAREWAHTLPDGRLLVMEGAGHAPFAESPERFLAAAESFLSGGWPQASAPG